MINKTMFFSLARQSTLFGGILTKQQVDGMEAKIDIWEKSGFTDLRWLAYMFATSYHETGRRMYTVEEIGKGKNKPYGSKLKMGKGPNKRIPYTKPDKIYYGRGDVQLTWYENYELMGRILGIDLLNYPEKALDPIVSAEIMIEGMIRGKSLRGDFTGVSLENYFNPSIKRGSKEEEQSWINARKIINGLDKAKIIAEYAKKFYNMFLASVE